MKNWMNEVMDDCIHLHACRRIQAIGKSLRLNCPRYCSDECTAYQSKNIDTGLIDVDTAVRYALNGVNSIRGGYDAYDVYASVDLRSDTLTLGDVLKMVDSE